MEQIRKPFQGVINIIKFNWHLYLLVIGIIFFGLILDGFISPYYRFYINILCLLITIVTLISLLVSFYVYDLSDLYSFTWVNKLVGSNDTIININAGFDEMSTFLNKKYPNSELHVFDFYNPSKHTEVSIKRARQISNPYPNTKSIKTDSLPLSDNYADKIFIVLSAHEIRSETERDIFFKELYRVTKNTGTVIITEHLRNLPNFLAYNIGFFHFFSQSSWYKIFKSADFNIYSKIKITPFITTFVLQKNGVPS